MHEYARLDGLFTIQKNGVTILQKKNLITNAGFGMTLEMLGKATSRPNWITHLAVGSDDTDPTVTDTALGTQLARVPATFSHTANAKTASFAGEFGAGVGTGAIVEAGLFNAATGGTMLNRIIFGAINKGAADILTITATINMSQG